MKNKDSVSHLPDILENAPLHYAPRNELGVVFLFSHLLRKLRLSIHEIRPQFPDCIAYQKVGGGQKKIRIEFEYKSSNFKTQRHNPKGCDWIVCWEHNWHDLPKNLTVIELKREFGLGFNVWVQSVRPDSLNENGDSISEMNYCDGWSVPSLAHKGDLIIFYNKKPDMCIKNLFKLDGKLIIDDNSDYGKYYAPIRRVCHLPSPIFLEDLQNHRILKTASFMRGNIQSRYNVTEYWPYLYEKIVRRNPSIKKVLARYDPEKF